MGIVKIVNRRPKSLDGMKRSIRYVLRNDREKLLTAVTGPYNFDEISGDNVFQSFLDEKKLWKKTDGRECSHSIISWHKDEIITAEEALDFGMAFAGRYFDGFQTLVVVHEDREHLHVHMITNSVSYYDGHKIHETRDGLMDMRRINDELCEVYGLPLAEKGKSYEGSERQELTTWKMSKHKVAEEKGSDIDTCFASIENAKSGSRSREDFIRIMKADGWDVDWNERKKHIVFSNSYGRRFRDTNLSRTFSIEISKQALTERFRRNQNMEETKDEEVPALDRAVPVAEKKYGVVKNKHRFKNRYGAEMPERDNSLSYPIEK